MNSTAGWGEARGPPGVPLTAGNAPWETSKTDWSTAREISGRAEPVPALSPCREAPRAAARPAGPALSPQAARAKPRPRRLRRTLLTLSSSSTGRKGVAAAKQERKSARWGLRRVSRCVQAAQCCLLTKPLSRAHAEIRAVPTPLLSRCSPRS